MTTFEQHVERLEAIVTELGREDLPLERALALFEEGVAALREASAQLGAAEARLQRLVERDDGTFDVVDLGS